MAGLCYNQRDTLTSNVERISGPLISQYWGNMVFDADLWV